MRGALLLLDRIGTDLQSLGVGKWMCWRNNLKKLSLHIFGIVMAVNPANALDLGKYSSLIMSEVGTSCATVTTAEEAAPCLIDLGRAAFMTRSNELYEVGQYIQELEQKVGVFHYEAPCGRDIELINQALERSSVLNVAPTFRAKSCDDAAAVFAGIMGTDISYRACPKVSEYSYESFRDCLATRMDASSIVNSANFFAQNFLRGDPAVARAILGERAISMPHLKEFVIAGADVSVVEGWHRKLASSLLKKCIYERDASGGTTADASSSFFADSYAFAQIDGAKYPPYSGKFRSHVTCTSVAQALLELGVVSEDEAASLLPGFDRCSPKRALEPPSTFETRDAGAKRAAAELCNSDGTIFVTELGRMMSGYRVKGAACEVDVLGLAMRTLTYQFASSECTVISEGNAQCSGTLRQFCVSGDRSREFLDCVGFNFEVSSVVDYKYDEDSCKWVAPDITIDQSTIKGSAPLQ